MIQLTRLNKSVLIVNSSLIALVEQSPDTLVTLVNGEKILVRERADEIVRLAIAFRRGLLLGIYPEVSSQVITPDLTTEDDGSAVAALSSGEREPGGQG